MTIIIVAFTENPLRSLRLCGENKMNWKEILKKYYKVEFNYPLTKLNTFGIGGLAEAFIYIETEKELKELIKIKNDSQIPLWVLGGGSNILISDEGISGLVIKLDGEFKHYLIENKRVITGAGTILSNLIKITTDMSLEGLEMLSGIPGTIGGATFCNAGAKGNSIGEHIILVKGINKSGESFILTKEELGFEYRHSNLTDENIITNIELSLIEGNKEELKRRISSYREQRKKTQPFNFKNAGCIFKNPLGNSAGKLIDQANCKGWREGDAEVSRLHANFIINNGKAKAKDVFNLIKRIRKEIKSKFNITLELEIKLIGKF